MKTIVIDLFEYDELKPAIQKKVLENLRTVNVRARWWEDIYADAESIGLRITSFDLDQNRHANGNFLFGAKEVAAKVIADHGMDTGTYKIAATYLSDNNKLAKAVAEAKEADAIEELCNQVEDLYAKFLTEMLEEYSKMLQSEMEDFMSDERILETIKANEWTFEADGTLRNGTETSVKLLFETDLHESRKSRVLLGAYTDDERLALDTQQVAQASKGEARYVIVNAELNKLEEQ